MNTGEYLISRSNLPVGTALDHLLNLVSSGIVISNGVQLDLELNSIITHYNTLAEEILYSKKVYQIDTTTKGVDLSISQSTITIDIDTESFNLSIGEHIGVYT